MSAHVHTCCRCAFRAGLFDLLVTNRCPNMHTMRGCTFFQNPSPIKQSTCPHRTNWVFTLKIKLSRQSLSCQTSKTRLCDVWLADTRLLRQKNGSLATWKSFSSLRCLLNGTSCLDSVSNFCQYVWKSPQFRGISSLLLPPTSVGFLNVALNSFDHLKPRQPAIRIHPHH